MRKYLIGLVAALTLGIGATGAMASPTHSCPGAGAGNSVVVHNVSCGTASKVLVAAGNHMERSDRLHFTMWTAGHRWMVQIKVLSAHRATMGAAYDGTHAVGASIGY